MFSRPSIASVYSTVNSYLQTAFTWGAGSVSTGILYACGKATRVSFVAAEAVGIYSAGKTLQGAMDVILSCFPISDLVKDLGVKDPQALRKRGFIDLSKGMGGLATATALTSLSGTFPTAAAISLQASKVLGAVGGVFFLGAEFADPRIWKKEDIDQEKLTIIRWALRATGTAFAVTGTFVPTLSVAGVVTTAAVGASFLWIQKSKVNAFIQNLLLD